MTTKNTPIYVTQPSLPRLEEFVEMLRDIWGTKWLTNQGKYHRVLEQALVDHLGVKHVSLFCNGTIALQVGLQALKITGEVITTPFSFPATTHSLWWNHCTPVFCDIDARTCNLDPNKIESLITPKTSAILPVHVYGTPCNVEETQAIADRYGLKVLYDAAHAFGVELEGESILNFGDLSMLSFHATKVFNTAEGGALITNDPKLKARIDYLKNFGFADETTVVAPGTNGKMSEIQAAYGLLQLKTIEDEISKCKKVAEIYRLELADIPGLRFPGDLPGVTSNYSYFPIFIEQKRFGIGRDELYERLKERGIYNRRYFYPLISSLPMYKHLPSAEPGNLSVARTVAEEVLCLPIYADLEPETVREVAGEIRGMIHADSHDERNGSQRSGLVTG